LNLFIGCIFLGSDQKTYGCDSFYIDVRPWFLFEIDRCFNIMHIMKTICLIIFNQTLFIKIWRLYVKESWSILSMLSIINMGNFLSTLIFFKEKRLLKQSLIKFFILVIVVIFIWSKTLSVSWPWLTTN
jgi:hypothetical protein